MDKKSRVKRFHYFTRSVRFLYDFLVYEDINLVLRRDRRSKFNINRLKNEKFYLKFFKRRYKFFLNKKNEIISLFKIRGQEKYNR